MLSTYESLCQSLLQNANHFSSFKSCPVCMYVSVYMYVCMYVYICIHTHTHIYRNDMNTHTHTHRNDMNSLIIHTLINCTHNILYNLHI